jgi:hypothetical protein
MRIAAIEGWNLTNSNLIELLKLRLLVGYLGERGQFGWWPTSFFGDYSMRSLEFVAPKTASLAQYHGAVEAARRLHDEHLSVGSYHLFRLPEEAEQDLHALMQSAQGAAVISALPKNKEAALAELGQLANTALAIAEGPVTVGSIDALNEPTTAKSIAGVYWKALSVNVKAYPYLVR